MKNMYIVIASPFNVCSENKYTKLSSNTLMRLVYLFSERTLVQFLKTPMNCKS